MIMAATVQSMGAFNAYNDINWATGELAGNITTGSPLAVTSVTLIDHDSGSPTPVTATFIVTGGACARYGAAWATPPTNSDAHLLLNGKLTYTNDYTEMNPGTVTTLTFTNLLPTNRYSISLYGTRGASGASYTGRLMHVTLDGATAFTNASSSGISLWTKAQANDSGQMAADNLDGKLFRYTGVNPGPDGVVSLVVSAYVNRAYICAFALQEFDPPASTSPPPALTNGPAARRQLGPSSRRTWLTISEIMYHPAGDSSNALEFVELRNTDPMWIDISGYSLAGDISYTFPANTILKGTGVVVVAKNPGLIQSTYGITNALGPFSNSLPNEGGTVRLRNAIGGFLLEVNYDDATPWPVAADGAGHSLVLGKPDLGEGNAEAWSSSSRIGGSPGAADPSITNYPLGKIHINEFMAHTDPPQEDFIELHNGHTVAVDISGCYLSDDANRLTRFQIPPGTTIPANGFKAYTQTQLGFGLSMHGGTLFLLNSSTNLILDAITYGPQANSIASGRFPDGAAEIHELTTGTVGSSNNATSLRIGNIVINEIMYNPPVNGEDEFIELHNRGTGTVDLSYWRFTDGIDYTFPNGTTLAGGGYLVVVKKRAHFLGSYTGIPSAKVYGDFDGSLSDSGERVVLAKPDDPALPYQDFVVMDEVTYSDGWGKWTDGGGSSLELMDPRSDNRRMANWLGSDESAKTTNLWTTIEKNGKLDHGWYEYPDYSWATENFHLNRAIRLFMLEAGECIVDDVEILRNGSSIGFDGSFNGGQGSWQILEGNHRDSAWESFSGQGASGAMHLRAEGDGNNAHNNLKCGIPWTLAHNDTNVTIRFKARWVSGSPAIMIHLQGNYMNCVGKMTLPSALGTPAAQNSRYDANAAPAIWDVTHAPLLPISGQSVTVKARVHDPDGLGSVQLYYRIDPSTSYSTIAMNDSGTAGDALAGDGIWSGNIPGQASNALAGFYVTAQDGSSQVTNFPADISAFDCLVMWGQGGPNGNKDYNVVRMWMTQATRNYFNGSRLRFSNGQEPTTLIYDDSRAIYGGGFRERSSNWTRSAPFDPATNFNSRQQFRISVPKSERLLGDDYMNFGGDLYHAWNMEELGLWAATQIRNAAVPQKDFVLYANNIYKGLASDDLNPSPTYLEMWFPDENQGDLYEVDDWAEFNEDAASYYWKWQNQNGYGTGPARLDVRLTTNGTHVAYKSEEYRWRFERSEPVTRESDNQPLYEVLTAFNSTLDSNYVTRLDAVIDIEQFCRTLAVRRYFRDWDSYGMFTGKNGYMFIPEGGKLKYLLWDMDTAMMGDTNEGLFTVGQDMTLSNKFFTVPAIRRAYWRAFQDLVDGPLKPATIEAQRQSQLNAYSNNSVITEAIALDDPANGGPVSIRDWLRGRASYVASQLLDLTNVTFSVTGGGGTIVTNPATISGSAPVRIATLRLNNMDQAVTWTSDTAWQARVWLTNSGNQTLTFSGMDINGSTAATAQVAVNFTGSDPSPTGNLVITEIMYHSDRDGGDFVELFNRSASTSLNLGGYRIEGLDFEFPAGTYLAPLSYGVVVESVPSFVGIYSNTAIILGAYSGELDDGGETLSLIKPLGTNSYMMIDEVCYDDDLPWPTEARGTGYSLQLIDPDRDNNRLANWTVARKWSRASGSGAQTSDTLYLYMTQAGETYIDDLWLALGSTPESGTNLLGNGSFEGGTLSPWVIAANHAESRLVDAGRRGERGLRLSALSPGSSGGTAISLSGLPVSGGQTYTLSYWYLPSPKGHSFTTRFSGSWISLSPNVTVSGAATPGAANVEDANIAEIPTLAINEICPRNTTVIQDEHGDFNSWLELYNPTASSVDLNAGTFYLTDDYLDLAKWAFTSSQSVPSTSRELVWCDGEFVTENDSANPHTSWTMNTASGGVALVQISGGRTSVIDYLDYSLIGTNQSYGSYPDGVTDARQIFALPTAGTVNSPTSGIVNIVINEWMADNTSGGVLADPADGDFDDWFELYNAGTGTVNLTGYMLTDLASSSNAFVIPGGISIAPDGHLLVWADNETDQISGNGLHVNFRLNDAIGESINLYSPGGVLIDSISFGPQRSNISEGSYPDGSSTIYSMAIPTPGTTNTLFRITRVTQGTSPGTLVVDSTVLPGQDYLIQTVGSLTSTNWTAYGADTNATSGTIRFTLPGNASRGFFRLRKQ